MYPLGPGRNHSPSPKFLGYSFFSPLVGTSWGLRFFFNFVFFSMAWFSFPGTPAPH